MPRDDCTLSGVPRRGRELRDFFLWNTGLVEGGFAGLKWDVLDLGSFTKCAAALAAGHNQRHIKIEGWQDDGRDLF